MWWLDNVSVAQRAQRLVSSHRQTVDGVENEKKLKFHVQDPLLEAKLVFFFCSHMKSYKYGIYYMVGNCDCQFKVKGLVW